MTILDSFRLDGRVAIVSGASSGLGVDFALGLAEAGADVVLAARRTDRLEDTAARVRALGRRVVAVPADVARPEDCQQVVDAAVTELGCLDILVNNAGIGTAVPALRETPEQFRSVIDVNLMGSFWLAQAAARVMQPGSSVVNISSILAFTTAGMPQAAYSASKAAIVGLTRDLAQQWAGRRGVRVNAVAPGYVVSEMTAVYDQAQQDALAGRTLLRRLGTPQEIATAVVWLASDASSYVCGQTIVVDGGFTIT
jgi:NAD(P)-dependent dehydrogenase (short-subunit alcohol dehydrogenase family)